MKLLISLFRDGLELTKAATWHNRAALFIALTGVCMGASYALKAFFDIDLGLTTDDANAIAGGIVTVAGVVFNVLASRTANANTGQPSDVVQPEAEPDRNVQDTMRAGG